MKAENILLKYPRKQKQSKQASDKTNKKAKLDIAATKTKTQNKEAFRIKKRFYAGEVRKTNVFVVFTQSCLPNARGN